MSERKYDSLKLKYDKQTAELERLRHEVSLLKEKNEEMNNIIERLSVDNDKCRDMFEANMASLNAARDSLNKMKDDVVNMKNLVYKNSKGVKIPFIIRFRLFVIKHFK